MASPHCPWIALLLVSAMTCDTGVFGRAVDALGLLSAPALRTDAPRRWRRGAAEAQRERCAELSAPWRGNARQAPEDHATPLQLRFRPFGPGASQGPVFPGKSLFSFVRRVYRCCQEGLDCRRVKGVQGRLRGGESQ